jgi:RNA polymerase sigma factor (TIGR02999 family)
MAGHVFHGFATLRVTGESGVPDDSEITQLLADWTAGEPEALRSLAPVVYAELRKIADAYLKRERDGHTLQPTALVNEAWLRLLAAHQPSFVSRHQFFGLAAQMMRRILVDHARRARAQKRGAGQARGELDEAPSVDAPTERLLALDEALTQLAAASPRQARIIELRYFAGRGVEEIGELLGISAATVSRDQKSAEAWLGVVLGTNGA